MLRVTAAAALCLALALAPDARAQPTTMVIVAGNVAESKSLTVNDLRRLPAHRIDYAPRRGVTEVPPDAPVRHYTGCLLRDVLTAAKPTESRPRELRRSFVVAAASDGYEVVFSWGFLSSGSDNVYVVYERDGAPLGDDEGRIALVTVTDRGSVHHVKWLRSLTLRAEQRAALWQPSRSGPVAKPRATRLTG